MARYDGSTMAEMTWREKLDEWDPKTGVRGLKKIMDELPPAPWTVDDWDVEDFKRRVRATAELLKSR